MSSSIGKEEIERLAKLSRIELSAKEEEKLSKDLGAILDYFNELKALDTSAIAPMTGGTDLKNVFREDGADDNGVDDDRHEKTNQGEGVDAFPESKDGYNKVPPVFE